MQLGIVLLKTLLRVLLRIVYEGRTWLRAHNGVCAL